MPIAVDIEDLEPAEFLLLLAKTSKTGKLTAVYRAQKILLALKEGSIVYAAQPAVRERLGSVLINRGLITEDDLYKALEIQRAEHGARLLGTILIDIGAITEEALHDVIRGQFGSAVRELMSWDGGVMVFNPMELADLNAIRINPNEVILGEGLETDELVTEDRADDVVEAEVESDDAEPADDDGDLESVVAALAEISTSAGDDDPDPMSSLMKEGADLSVSLTAEMTLAILGAASEVAERAVLLLVYPGYLSGIGGFGETTDGGQVTGQEVRVPRHLPSVFNTVADTAQVMRGPLDSADGNEHFLAELGGRSNGDAVVIPMTVSDTVVAVLYVDGGLDGGKLDSTSVLEGVVAGIGRSLES